jgi:hypothetical protein
MAQVAAGFVLRTNPPDCCTIHACNALPCNMTIAGRCTHRADVPFAGRLADALAARACHSTGTLLPFLVMVATANYGPNSHRKQTREAIEVLDMQREAYAKAMNPKLPDRDRREWMRTYEMLSERRRILANKPLPGSLKPEMHKQRAMSKLANLYAMPTSTTPAEPSTTPSTGDAPS